MKPPFSKRLDRVATLWFFCLPLLTFGILFAGRVYAKTVKLAPPLITLSTPLRGPFFIPKLASQGKVVSGMIRLTLAVKDTPENRAAVVKLEGSQVNGSIG